MSSRAKSNGEVAYSDLTDSGDDTDLDNDGVGLVLKDEDAASGRSRRYVVSDSNSYSRYIPSWCQPSRLTRNERTCVVVGCVVLVAILAVFVAVGVVAARSKVGGSEGGSNNGTDHSGGNGTNGTDHGNNGTGGGEVPWASIRLQSSVVPEVYDISLTVDMNSFHVSGVVNITCSVVDDVDYVALHAADMAITRHVLESAGKMVEHSEVLYPDNDFYVFNLTSPLEPGQIVVTLHFNYTLREDLAGFYRSSYMDSNGEQQYLATTQFESTDARRAFPCFDEPSLKANFTMHITHQSRYRAWFNMPDLDRTQPDSNGMVTTHFQTSVKMSTYLVAFIVSDFQCVNDTIVSISGKDVMVSICIDKL